MPHLHLVAAQVALTNIEKIDKLGAFNGEDRCCYHYRVYANDEDEGTPTGCHCAIGIMDHEGLLQEDDNTIGAYLRDSPELVTADNPEVVQFIQRLHDWKANTGNGDDYFLAFLGKRDDEFPGLPRERVPPKVGPLLRVLKHPDNLTKTRYVRIMKRIAEHAGA